MLGDARRSSLSAVLLLAIDTSTSAITVALHDGRRVLAERSTIDPADHTEHVAPSISAVLAEAGRTAADVTAVAVGVGPGPFTGLRVGMVTASVFAHARGIPVHGVCSLDALAHEAASSRRGAGGVRGRHRRAAQGGLLGPVCRGARRRRRACPRAPADRPGGGLPARPSARPWTAPPWSGRGAVLYPDLLSPQAGPLDVSAAALAEVALAELGAGKHLPVEPLYLRRPDAAPAHPRKPALPAAARSPAGAEHGACASCAGPTSSELAALERELFPQDAWAEPTWWSELAARPQRDYVVEEDPAGIAGYAGLNLGGEVADVMTIAVATRAQGPRTRAAPARGAGRAGAGMTARSTSCSRCATTTLPARGLYEQGRLRGPDHPPPLLPAG